MSHADTILEGPRGRGLCAGLLPCRNGTSIGWWHDGYPPPRRAQQLDDLAAAVGRTDLHAVALGWRLDAALDAAVADAQHYQEPERLDLELADDDVVELLRPVAEAVAAAPDARWWWEPADPSNQVAVVWSELITGVDKERDRPDERSPRLTGTRAGLDAWHRLGPTTWWSGPSHAGLPLTTGRVPFHPDPPDPPCEVPVGLWLVEDPMGWHSARTWPVRAPAGARIHEVTGAAEWLELTQRFPRPVGRAAAAEWSRNTGVSTPWLVPDYRAVAEEFDGIHLTVAGWLAIAGRALPIEGRPEHAYLAGWGPDVTWWLADVLQLSGEPTDWVESHIGTLGWLPT